MSNKEENKSNDKCDDGDLGIGLFGDSKDDQLEYKPAPRYFGTMGNNTKVEEPKYDLHYEDDGSDPLELSMFDS